MLIGGAACTRCIWRYPRTGKCITSTADDGAKRGWFSRRGAALPAATCRARSAPAGDGGTPRASRRWLGPRVRGRRFRACPPTARCCCSRPTPPWWCFRRGPIPYGIIGAPLSPPRKRLPQPCCGAARRQAKERASFCEQKEAKNFVNLGRAGFGPRAQRSKSFGRFFKKRPLPLALYLGLANAGRDTS